jgi:hypothetical protein
MHALEADAVDAVWAATKPLLPHRRSIRRAVTGHVPDRLCLWALLIRPTTGASWGRHRRPIETVVLTAAARLANRRSRWAS